MRWTELALCYNGLLALCLAVPKHARRLHTATPLKEHGWIWRLGGWVGLAAAFAVSVATNGWAFGPVEWIGMISATGLTLVITLPFAPRMAAATGILLLAASLLLE